MRCSRALVRAELGMPRGGGGGGAPDGESCRDGACLEAPADGLFKALQLLDADMVAVLVVQSRVYMLQLQRSFLEAGRLLHLLQGALQRATSRLTVADVYNKCQEELSEHAAVSISWMRILMAAKVSPSIARQGSRGSPAVTR